MNVAKVWNDNELPFSQKWKDENVFIPAKSFIEMEYDDAIAFKSYPYPMMKDGMGQQTKESYKMIRVEGSYNGNQSITAFRSHVDGSIHLTKEALAAHDAEFSHMQVKDSAPVLDEEEIPVAKKRPK